MRIAVPIHDGHFSEHFGRCTGFLLCDAEAGQPGRVREIVRPRVKGKCESIPQWLAEMGVTHILAGGIGETGRGQFEKLGIVVSPGHKGRDAQEVLMQFLAAAPAPAANPCAEFEHRHHHCRDGTKRKPSS